MTGHQEGESLWGYVFKTCACVEENWDTEKMTGVRKGYKCEMEFFASCAVGFEVCLDCFGVVC